MNWTLANLKDMADVFQSVATPTALVIAGIWAYKKYVVEGSKYPHIQSSAAMDFIGQQGGYWIVELRAVLENKGKVEHRIADFGFDLNAIFSSEQVAVSGVRYG